MKTPKPEIQRRLGPGATKGFTLVELLVVISIIALLATLLIPTIQTILEQVYVGRSAFVIRRLHDGAMIYRDKTGFFPGEIKDSKVPHTSGYPRKAMDAGTLTGSQVLAACLFDIDYDDLNTPNGITAKTVSNPVIPYIEGDLISMDTSVTGGATLKHNTISDGFPADKAMAVCYFLASNSPSYNNKTTQFRYQHNAAYLNAQGTDPQLTQTHLNTWLVSKSPSPRTVLNNSEFILIAPGLNRQYLLREFPDPADPEKSLFETDSDDLANSYGGTEQ